RLAQQRAVAQLAREPRLLEGRAGVHPELFAGVVADIRILQVHRPAPRLQGSEAIADHQLQRVVAGGDVAQQRVQPLRDGEGQPRVANARKARAEGGRDPCQRLEALLQLLPRLAGAIRELEAASLCAHTCHGADQRRRELDPVAGRALGEPVEALADFAGGEVVATHAATVPAPSDIPGAREERGAPRCPTLSGEGGRGEGIEQGVPADIAVPAGNGRSSWVTASDTQNCRLPALEQTSDSPS